MAVSFVASGAWAVSVSNVTPTLPVGAATGDLNVLALVSKYDDAVVATPPGPPWTDHGAVANTGRAAGNDTGNLRTRGWSGVHDGSAMPTLDPAPNNVSVAHVTTYRVAAGKAFDVAAEPVKDDTVGSPLVLTAASTLGLTAGDVLHVDLAVNGDVVTFGTPTLTVPGCTMSAASTNTADSSTTSGTDLRYRSVRYTVSSGTAAGPPSYSLTLAGTTTNAVGVGVMARIREAAAAEVHTSTGSALSRGSAQSLVTTVRTLSGAALAKAAATGSASTTRSAVAVAVARAAATGTTVTTRTTSGTAVSRALASATTAAVVEEVHATVGQATSRASAQATTTTTRSAAGSAVARASSTAQTTTARPTSGAARAAASGQGVTATTRAAGGTAASRASAGAGVLTVRTTAGQAVSRASATGVASGGTGAAPEIRTTTGQALSRAAAVAATTTLRTVDAAALGRATARAATTSLRASAGTALSRATAYATTTATTGETPMPTVVYNLTTGTPAASSVATGTGRPTTVTRGRP